MCRASAEDKYYAIRLIKYSFKKRKKIKNTRGVHIFFSIWGPGGTPRVLHALHEYIVCNRM